MMKNKFCQDIEMQKMTGFLDEKYTPGNMKNIHAGGTNILVKVNSETATKMNEQAKK
jgi:hypothetical protein